MTDDPKIVFLAKPSLRRAFFFAAIYLAFMLYGLSATDYDPRYNPFWSFLTTILAAALGLALLRRWTTTYMITTEEIHCQSGILSRTDAVVPISRITNSMSRQSFLERLLGLDNLYVDTAGSESTELMFMRILRSDSLKASKLIRDMRSAHIKALEVSDELGETR